MSSLRVGYDLFAGSSQAGTDASIPGVVQVETASAVKHYIELQRLNGNEYWDWVAEAWQAGIPTDAENGVVQGSVGYGGNTPANRRLAMRLPAEALAGIGAAGCVINVYPDGGTAATNGVEITLAYLPVTA